jgi:hypothetical protein
MDHSQVPGGGSGRGHAVAVLVLLVLAIAVLGALVIVAATGAATG